MAQKDFKKEIAAGEDKFFDPRNADHVKCLGNVNKAPKLSYLDTAVLNDNSAMAELLLARGAKSNESRIAAQVQSYADNVRVQKTRKDQGGKQI